MRIFKFMHAWAQLVRSWFLCGVDGGVALFCCVLYVLDKTRHRLAFLPTSMMGLPDKRGIM